MNLSRHSQSSTSNRIGRYLGDHLTRNQWSDWFQYWRETMADGGRGRPPSFGERTRDWRYHTGRWSASYCSNQLMTKPLVLVSGFDCWLRNQLRKHSAASPQFVITHTPSGTITLLVGAGVNDSTISNAVSPTPRDAHLSLHTLF